MDLYKVMKVRLNKRAGLDYEGQFVTGVRSPDGGFRLKEEFEGRKWFDETEYDVVPENKNYSVTTWVTDEEDLTNLLQTLKNNGYIGDIELNIWK